MENSRRGRGQTASPGEGSGGLSCWYAQAAGLRRRVGWIRREEAEDDLSPGRRGIPRRPPRALRWRIAQQALETNRAITRRQRGDAVS